MTFRTHYIMYPEGDSLEISHTLRVGQVVDLNGNPLSFPLPSVKIIAYRVYRISTREFPGEEARIYYLEPVRPAELAYE